MCAYKPNKRVEKHQKNSHAANASTITCGDAALVHHPHHAAAVLAFDQMKEKNIELVSAVITRGKAPSSEPVRWAKPCDPNLKKVQAIKFYRVTRLDLNILNASEKFLCIQEIKISISMHPKINISILFTLYQG
jgi:hypothetical protein